MPEVNADREDASWESAWDEDDNAAESAAVAAVDAAADGGNEDPPGELEGDQPQEHPEVAQPAAAGPDLSGALRQLAESQKQYADSVTQSVGGLADQLRQVNAEAAVARQTPGGPSQEEIDRATKDPDSWAKLKEDWSEWAGPIEEMFDHRIKAAIKAAGTVDEQALEAKLWSKVQERLKSERAQELADLQARQEQERAFQSEYAKVVQAYPKFDEVRTSKEFREWAEIQSPGVKALAGSMHAADALTMMNLYEASRPAPRTAAVVHQERQTRARQSAIPSRTITQAPQRAIDTRNMSWEEAWAYDDQIKAQRQTARA